MAFVRDVGSSPASMRQVLFLLTFSGSVVVSHDGSHRRDGIDQVSSLICRNCGQGTVVVEEQWVGDHPVRERMTGGMLSWRGFHWWPLPQAKKSADVPSDIADALAEAATALAAGCYRASAVMARRTLEAVTADQGESNGTLATRLAALSSKGVLQPTLGDWAKEVRLVGNTGAHFDPIDTVPKEDAEQLLSFVQELLRYLYELPAELNRRRSGGTPSGGVQARPTDAEK
jgi:hypothetical protein